ncbi:MAG: efflux RND transporter periplasmic adaptor subunit [Armatimonadota bacterium]|nr:efflux RND transporter periplasmic adaptor subunit [Armatimonadota bacterium]MDR7427463.1 efflux RND transporter periplasmic adaptor subunit [Armatimonadota bacterium]MDR7469977.1 efflux RND transporter periplasmic adaptor subunit [Armatimonadota bacterium]MDR7474483.1 efflux RND transporter periplasmic adaptor subunit [Armatimonadota bacterium]MDR7538741.1 efflux RND transporter periplasmic adaptor subunit [Armatimonadota bacterium]
MRRRGLVLFVLLAAAAGGLIWSLRQVFPRPLTEVEGARIGRGPLEVMLPVTGIFETRTLELTFDLPGRLARVAVAEGQSVSAGALIATVEEDELLAAVDQAEAGLRVADEEAARAAAAVDATKRQAEQARAAVRAATAALAQLQAGPRPDELRQADAAVESARAALEEARRSLERARRLFRDGAVSAAQLEAAQLQAQTADARYRQAVAQRDLLRAGARPEALAAAAAQVRQAEAAWEAARANVRQAEAAAAAARARVAQARAALRAATVRLARGRLRAPFAGTVTRVYLTPGSPVGPGIPVASLAASSGWITADVDEADIGQVRLGQTARITADAYPGRIFHGRVTRIGQAVEIRLGSRVVRVRIDLEGSATMRAGTSVDIRLLLRAIPDALLAPAEAVHASADDGRPYVFLIEGGRLRRREVRTGEGNDEFMVIQDGLTEGDLVAVGEAGRLRDGQRVRVLVVR